MNVIFRGQRLHLIKNSRGYQNYQYIMRQNNVNPFLKEFELFLTARAQVAKPFRSTYNKVR